jgi:hypothetical protein
MIENNQEVIKIEKIEQHFECDLDWSQSYALFEKLGEAIILKKMQELNDEERQNFEMSVQFNIEFYTRSIFAWRHEDD